MAAIKGFSQINLPNDLLERVVDSITSAVPTDSIYIFGSYARGEERPDSDVDIYVITSDAKKRPIAYGADVRGALMWMPLRKDVLSASKDVFDEKKEHFWKVESQVVSEGVKIYG